MINSTSSTLYYFVWLNADTGLQKDRQQRSFERKKKPLCWSRKNANTPRTSKFQFIFNQHFLSPAARLIFRSELQVVSITQAATKNSFCLLKKQKLIIDIFAFCPIINTIRSQGGSSNHPLRPLRAKALEVLTGTVPLPFCTSLNGIFLLLFFCSYFIAIH